MLGLSAPLALLATVVATVLSPIYLPPLASWSAGTHLSIDPLAMTVRLAVIVGGACVCATLLRRYAETLVARNPHAMTGVAVIGLILVAIGAMRGMQRYFLDHPAEVTGTLAESHRSSAGDQRLVDGGGAARFVEVSAVLVSLGVAAGGQRFHVMVERCQALLPLESCWIWHLAASVEPCRVRVIRVHQWKAAASSTPRMKSFEPHAL
jgi:hypothetical protein